MKAIKKTRGCLICKNKKLVKYLDLGKSAPANSYLTAKQLSKKEDVFPLRVYYCPKCHLAQLTDIVDRKLLFEDYAYFSSASPQLEKYFSDYAAEVVKRFPKQAQFTLEIASNDGILLKYFKNLGSKVLGIDPAKNIIGVANKQGIKTLPWFFNKKTAEVIKKKYGTPGIITANNVLAHTDDLHGIISGVKKILAPDGVFVFEAQYLGDLLKKNEFDNTYHEHACYFSLAPLISLLNQYNLTIFNVQRVAGQGGSLRVYAQHTRAQHPINPSVKKLLATEKKQGLYRKKTYVAFGATPKKIKQDLATLLANLKKQGKTIVGYGASAKGNTLLQYSNIGTNLIDYIVDNAPSKQGKFTPGMHIPIYKPDYLKKKIPDYVLLLAWNYADSIMDRESWLRDYGVKFIKPIPKVTIV